MPPRIQAQIMLHVSVGGVPRVPESPCRTSHSEIFVNFAMKECDTCLNWLSLLLCAPGVGQAVALVQRKGGKSGLHRAERQVTPGRRKPTESAAESKPPGRFFQVVR